MVDAANHLEFARPDELREDGIEAFESSDAFHDIRLDHVDEPVAGESRGRSDNWTNRIDQGADGSWECATPPAKRSTKR